MSVLPNCVLPTQVTKLGVKGTVRVISRIPMIHYGNWSGIGVQFLETHDGQEVTKQRVSGHTSCTSVSEKKNRK